MKIVVLGAGAIGSYFGGMLAKKFDVTLLGRAPHINAIKQKGLKITGITYITVNPRGITEFFKIKKPELVIITVKSYDTEKVVKESFPHIRDSIILSMQNGLNNEKIILDIMGDNVLGGITSHGVTFVKPGVIYHAGIGETIIGELNGKSTKRINEIKKMFDSVGINCSVSKNILGQIWTKTIVNAGINPITAIHRINNGEILKNEKLIETMENVCLEGIEVAKKANIRLPGCDILEKTKNVARLTENNKSSMLQDIEKGKKTEIDSINGAIVENGKKLGVPTPVNIELIGLIKNIEKSIVIN